MALTNFEPRKTLVTADWLNKVDRYVENTSTELASTSGATLIGTTSGDNVQEVLDRQKQTGPLPTDFPWLCDATGATDCTLNFQIYLDYCRDNGSPWTVPNGTFLVTSVTAYTAGTCYGEFVSANDSALGPVVSIAPVAADITTLTVATINAWTGLVRGTEKSSDFASYYGRTVAMISGDETVIARLGSTGVFYRESFVVHDTDGSIYPPISSTKAATWTTPNTTAVAVVNRDPIVITGLRVRISSTGAGERNSVVRVTRPNTILLACGVVSDSAAAVQQGFLAQYCSGVQFNRCTVEGMLDTTTQYGFNVDSACGITYVDCSEINCRRGIDGTGVKNMRIRGGSFPDGIGTHWGVDCAADGLAYLSSDPSNTAPGWWAGEDFSITNSNIVLRPDQYIVMGLRSDIFEARGKWHLTDNTITIDCTANTATARYLSDFTSNSTTHNWGRLIFMPDNVKITGNRIRQLGASFSTTLFLMRMFGNAPTPPSGISAGGQIDISGNSFEMAAGVLNGSNPRIALQLNKQTCWTAGDGYRIRANDLPSLQVFLFCAAAHPTPSTSRAVFSGDNIGTILWQPNYGAWLKGEFDCQTMVNNFNASRPGGGYATPIGDEIENRTTQLFALASWNPGNILAGAFEGVDVTVPGCAVGDKGIASFTGATADGWLYDASCQVAGTMRVVLYNGTGGAVNPSSGTLRVKVLKY